MFSIHIQVCAHVFRFSSQVWVFIFRYLCSGVQVKWSVFRVGYSGVGFRFGNSHSGAFTLRYSCLGISVWVWVFMFRYFIWVLWFSTWVWVFRFGYSCPGILNWVLGFCQNRKSTR